MQFKQTLVRLAFILLPLTSFSQTTYLPFGSKENILLERLEIKAGTDSVLNFSKTKPLSRRQFISRLSQIDTSIITSAVDRYNLRSAYLSNIEWAPAPAADYPSKRNFLKNFYKTPANFYEVHTPNFFLAVNPIFQYVVAKENDNDQHIFSKQSWYYFSWTHSR